MKKLLSYSVLLMLSLLPVGVCVAHQDQNNQEMESKIDFAPPIAVPRNIPSEKEPRAYKLPKGFALENQALRAQFSTEAGLKLVSLHNEYTGKNILIDPTQTRLFLIETGGKRFGASDWSILSINQSATQSITAQLYLEQYKLEAKLTLTMLNEGLRMALSIQNSSTSSQKWKASFPSLEGLSVSENPKDDYYLFPYKGGVINHIDSNIRTYYGGNTAWWQMVDIFSPQAGCGLSLRSLDETGSFKGIAFRKGESVDEAATLISSMRGMAEDLVWKDSLPAKRGSSVSFEYNTDTVPDSEDIKYPDALISVHPGGWKMAMREYADWAHRVWNWRPINTKMDDVWDFHTLSINRGNPANILFNGKWYDNFSNDGYDMAEFVSWWEWADKGPFGISLANAQKEGGEAFYKRFKTDLSQINPATGKRAYPYNRGDYDYNESWGGLEALKKTINKAHDAGQFVQFYTDPYLVDDNSEFAKKYLPKFATYNPSFPKSTLPNTPKAGYDISYGQWVTCIDSQEYQNIFIQQMKRIVRDTGVDSIRFDQMGGGGYPCYNPLHRHIFQKNDGMGRLQASELLARDARKEIKEIKPDFLISAEYIGYDFLASQLDSSLVHETKNHVHPALRPLPVSVFRFYFPEIKLYEYLGGNQPEQVFWNALGTFYAHPLPKKYTQVLKENGDAFRGTNPEPLVPTLIKHVYGNRFSTRDKEITLLYNDLSNDASGAVLNTSHTANQHYFDLLNGRRVVIQDEKVAMNIKSAGVAVVAKLPKLIQATKVNSGWSIKLNQVIPYARLVSYNAEGEVLSKIDINHEAVSLQNITGKQLAYAKLFSGKYLKDAVDLR